MESIDWKPEQQTLEHIVLLLETPEKQSLTEQRKRQHELNEYSKDLIFCRYLAFIFGEWGDDNIAIKQMAGLALKSQIEANFAFVTMETIEYCKEMIMKAYQSPVKVIRETAGNVISLIIFRGGLNIWHGILEFFIQKFDDEDESIIETAVKSVWFIVEDSGRMFEEPKFSEEMDQLLPSLSKLLMADPPMNERILSTVINTINMLIILSTETIYENTEKYLEVLLKTACDPSVEVRKRSVQGITTIVDFRLELVIKHAQEVLDIMLNWLNEKDQDVGLAAAEFWSGLAINRGEDDDIDQQRVEIIDKYLPILAPILLECCRFVEADKIASMPTTKNDLNIYKEGYYEDNEDEEIEDGEGEYSSLESMSTLRRASAFSFEQLAKVSGKILFESICETIGKYLQDQNDIAGKEASILVLGVIAEDESSSTYITPYVNDLLPILWNFLDDDLNKIKTTAWWTISKFFRHIIQNSIDDIWAITYKLLSWMKTTDHELQEASWTSITDLIEASSDWREGFFGDTDPQADTNESSILPFDLQIDICKTFQEVWKYYNGNSLIYLLDMMGFYSKIFTKVMKMKDAVEMIMSPLTEKWNQLSDEDKMICPLFDCFKSLAQAIGTGIDPYACIIVERWWRVIAIVVNSIEDQNSKFNIDMEFSVKSFDLLSAVIKNTSDWSLILKQDYYEVLYKWINWRNSSGTFIKLWFLNKFAFNIIFLKIGVIWKLYELLTNLSYQKIILKFYDFRILNIILK